MTKTNVYLCPTCKIKMNKDYFNLMRIKFCEKCKIIWINKIELDVTLKNHGNIQNKFSTEITKLESNSQGISIVCLKCKDSNLNQYKWNDAIYQYCKKCNGILITPSNLDKILKHLKVIKINSGVDLPSAIIDGLLMNLDKLIP